MHLFLFDFSHAGVRLMDYVDFGGKNLWMPGRKRAHTREDGAACCAEVGPLLGPEMDRNSPSVRRHGRGRRNVPGRAERGRVALEVSGGRREDREREHRLSAECRMRSESRRDCALGTSVAKHSPQHVLGGRRRCTASSGPNRPSQGGSQFLGRSNWRVCMHACV